MLQQRTQFGWYALVSLAASGTSTETRKHVHACLVSARRSSSCLTLCDTKVPLVFWVNDEPLVFLHSVLIAFCAHVQYPRLPSGRGVL